MDKSMTKFSTSIKYLRVIITNTLSWEKQVTKTTNKVHSVLYQLKLCKIYLQKHSELTSYVPDTTALGL